MDGEQPETTLAPRRSPQQSLLFIKADCVDTEAGFLGNMANPCSGHFLYSRIQNTIWSQLQSQVRCEPMPETLLSAPG
jgi:hypothetical protein